MNNKVTPQAGQVWKGEVCITGMVERTIREVIHDGDYHPAVYFTCSNHTKELINHWEFVPANNLEWLAVNVGLWIFKDDLNISRKCNSPMGYVVGTGCKFTKQQWQECRYKLGLDERSKEKVKMIDLSGAVVGEKFDCQDGLVVTLACISKNKKNFCMETDRGYFNSCLSNGEFHSGENSVVKKHDTRPWLKDLPDALVFEFYGAILLTFKSTVGWFITLDDGCTLNVPVSKIPPLKEGDSILISSLAKWQSENKKTKDLVVTKEYLK